jgi:hypothetical protein
MSVLHCVVRPGVRGFLYTVKGMKVLKFQAVSSWFGVVGGRI